MLRIIQGGLRLPLVAALWCGLFGGCAAVSHSVATSETPTAPLQVPVDTPDAENIALSRQQKQAPRFTWQDLSPAALQQAKTEGKLLLLDCVATWCHWCHVMDDTTYTDPALGDYLAQHAIAMRVDIDARPDIASRYEEWGWPATVILSPNGQELGKFRGYLTAPRLLEILQAARENSGNAELKPAAVGLSEKPLPPASLSWVGAVLLHTLDNFYDADQGGWGRGQKLPIGANIEVELLRAQHGDQPAQQRAQQSLDAQRALLDPVWGGLYQYSTGGVWTKPHFEKRLPIQTAAIEAYARAYHGMHRPSDLQDTQRLVAYLHNFLRNADGEFLVSQDADLGGHEKTAHFVDGHLYYAKSDAERRAQGMPRIDSHVYAMENGLAIGALSALAVATGSAADAGSYLASAERAAKRMLSRHVEVDGTVKRDAVATSSLRFLVDAAALGRGLAMLQRARPQANLVPILEQLAGAMLRNFKDDQSGLLWTSTLDPAASGVFAQRSHSFAANVQAARFLLTLAHLQAVTPAQKLKWQNAARQLLSNLATPSQLDDQGRMVGEYILALEEAGLLTWHPH